MIDSAIQVAPSHKLVFLDAKFKPQLSEVFPRVADYRGKCVVPFDVQSVTVLRNMGHPVPSPIEFYYDWPIGHGMTPFKHQIATAAFLVNNPRAFCLNDMGTGKTLSLYWAADFLMTQRVVRRGLIVAPLSTLHRVHGETIFKTFIGNRRRTFAVLHGSAKLRKELIRQDHDFYIINYDGVEVCLNTLIARADIDLIAFDEGALLRNSQTDRWKAMRALLNTPRKYVWSFTGTPTPNEPTDAYGQIKLVRPENLRNIPSFRAFKDLTMTKLTAFKWAAKDDAMHIVAHHMVPSIRFARSECIDLPPMTYTTLDVELSAQQKAAYKQLLNEYVTEIAGNKITAVNEAVKLMRLIQVTSGVVYDTNGKHHRVDCAGRFKVLEETIEEAPAKVLVFAPFKGDLPLIREKLEKRWTCAVVSGDTAAGERNRIFSAFESETSAPHVLIAHPECMAHGLNFISCATIIWWAPVNSNEIYQQANDRIPRPGQRRNMQIVHLSGTPVERQTYKRLETKQGLQGILLNMVQNNRGESFM